ncbi:MAG: phenylalanine--tRNA ligase subunit beta [Clostridia bacterium]|nr:phenylalanine--tRNA ligase subunit beta [Clostridia bacterium]
MKAPLSWLKEYVDIDCSAEDLKDKLFSCGFEVEEMEYIAKNIDKIVSCKILSIDKHPNADKLSVTKVDAGKYGEKQIITSAKNIAVGDVVPVALDGATLFNGERIFNGELRGVPSEGMFCSGEELGINDDWYKGASVNGILILDKSFPLGEEVKTLLDLEDVMFDINVTANRPDCQSILGIAREVAAVLSKPFKMPDLTYTTDKNISTVKTVKVSDLATDLCPRYVSHLVKDIKIEESPLWMKRRLFRMGIRSINNVVDITNYVLLEIGQPMHAFDLSNIEGNEIIVRRANENEKIVTLDEKEFILSENNLVICDSVKPVALAGVMGGLNSEIKDDTKDVLFESAKFKRDNIRKTSRALGQRSDSSSRFEKGIDAYTTEIGMKRALNLITTLKCGTIACDEYDLCAEKLVEKTIETTLSKVNAVLGIDVPKDEIKNILTKLNFKVEINGDNLTVKVPLYREDMESYPDIAEEIIREYGYSHITPTLLKNSSITNGKKTDSQKAVDNVKTFLTSLGFNEIITYSFVSEKDYDLFGFDKESEEHKFIKIINPIGEDMAVMRTSLLPSIVKTVVYNQNRQNDSGRLFELAKVYHPKSLPLNDFPIENNVLSFSVFGEKEDFFTLKGVIEKLLSNFAYGVDFDYISCDYKFMHPTRSAIIKSGDKIIGYFGQLNPILAEKVGSDKPILCGEIFYDVLSTLFVPKIVFSNISKFPTVERDIAILVDETITCKEITDVIKESAGENLIEVSLFDIYQGNQVEKGKKSMAFNLVYNSQLRTLNVEEIDASISDVLSALKQKVGAELR